ncbi:MAG: hypothetical protein Q4F41_07240 [Eubacteriales bacterium]|nr:hypothetical protein [Eubacteriales bacterium]
MFKLMKYEFRKNRNTLLAIGGGLLLLQLYFLFNILTFNETEEKLTVSAIFLYLYAIVCFFAVFILAAYNYSRELNSKSSYLIFMTPTSSYTILFSKLLSTLILGIAIAAVLGVLGAVDMNLYSQAIPESEDFASLLRFALETLGFSVGTILLNILTGILTFLVNFFAIVSLVYLSVTLSATFLQNSKLKSVLSVLLFLLLTYLVSKVTSVLPVIYEMPEDMTEAILNVLPATLFNLVVFLASIFTCGKLLDKKVSL